MTDSLLPIRVTAVQQNIKVTVKPNETKIITRVEQQNIKVKLSSAYVHPPTHSANMIVTNDERQFVSAEEKELIHKRTYIHNQQVASDTWTVIHDLGKHPAVSVVDSSGKLVIGDVLYVSSSQIIIKFKAKFAGTAYLN